MCVITRKESQERVNYAASFGMYMDVHEKTGYLRQIGGRSKLENPDIVKGGPTVVPSEL